MHGMNERSGDKNDLSVRPGTANSDVSFVGKQLSWEMLRNRWQEARKSARLKAISEKQPERANRIAQFQFTDIRPKAASEINDLADASVLLDHSKEGITERDYRRVGEVVSPTKSRTGG